MLVRLRRHVTYANVMSTIAAVAAMSGVAWAASLPRNSVGTKQLKRGAVTNRKIGRDAVTGSKVKNGSLGAAEFAPGTLLQGPPGKDGADGADGAPGKDGVNGAADVTYRTVLSNTLGNGIEGEAGAPCGAGEKLIGGGGGWVNDASPPTSYPHSGTLSDNGPATAGNAPIAAGATPAKWHVSGVNTTGVSARLLAYAVCATP